MSKGITLAQMVNDAIGVDKFENNLIFGADREKHSYYMCEVYEI